MQLKRLVVLSSIALAFVSVALGLPEVQPSPKGEPRSASLTMAERLTSQRAIEEVYWRHRIWPTGRPESKPPLDQLISEEEIEQKVRQYLHNSQTLEEKWHITLTTEQLQAEMDRMAQHTQQSGVLREIFNALGDDPFVIAECLARPVLAERLINSLHGDPNPAEALSQTGAAMPNAQETLKAAASAAGYLLPAISAPSSSGCVDNTWTPTTTVNAPAGRSEQAAVWTGSEMIVWGGTICGSTTCGGTNTGGRYNPATDSWSPTSTTNAPTGRAHQTAVWTGSQMIVWGGYDEGSDSYFNTGGKYNPASNSWTAVSAVNAPIPRTAHTAVWTGSEMIVWGGVVDNGFNTFYLNDGGRYNPTTNAWTAVDTAQAPNGRAYHTAIWTGSEMIVWGGEGVSGTTILYFETGARYHPSSNTWTPVSLTNGSGPRSHHTAIWTGSEMIVWGGQNDNGVSGTGALYDPTGDAWTPTSPVNAPPARANHTAVWTGSEMIIWDGYPFGRGGGRFVVAGGGWVQIPPTNDSPFSRDYHSAVWTGQQMIVWGGEGQYTGGKYCAGTGVVANGAGLQTEGCSPPNNHLDPGETVTVAFCLRSASAQSTTDLTATLQSSGGVVGPSAPQSYGALSATSGPACRNFTFTANRDCGDVVTATLQLQDGSNNLGTATYTFGVGEPTNILAEGFDYFPSAFSGGAMQNNSQPAGTTSWFQGSSVAFPSHSGYENSYVAANSNNASGTGTINNWLITPAITLQNGTRLTFYTRTVANPTRPDRLQVRMSVNGSSTDTGGTATSVGDFSTALLDINPTYTRDGYPTRWTQFTVTLQGIATPTTGRLAFRYFVENGGPSGSRSDYLGIDTVSIDTYSCCPDRTPTPVYNVAASAAPNSSGSVLGGGTYGTGSSVILTATPAPNFQFANWTENGGIVSASATYIFTADSDRAVIANFVSALPTVATPAISPNGGTFKKKVKISLRDSTSGAKIHYTTDGTDPTASSSTYKKPFKVTGAGTKTVKAKGIKNGFNDSATATSNFTIR